MSVPRQSGMSLKREKNAKNSPVLTRLTIPEYRTIPVHLINNLISDCVHSMSVYAEKLRLISLKTVLLTIIFKANFSNVQR
jgi:hypothetical protein